MLSETKLTAIRNGASCIRGAGGVIIVQLLSHIDAQVAALAKCQKDLEQAQRDSDANHELWCEAEDRARVAEGKVVAAVAFVAKVRSWEEQWEPHDKYVVADIVTVRKALAAYAKATEASDG